jgi:uncharacterized metal-binding protein YceD (DUF177 family)
LEALRDHTITIAGLPEGQHNFPFLLEDAFFSMTGNDELRGGAVRVNVSMLRTADLWVADVEAKGSVKVNCDRCDGPLEVAVAGKLRHLYRLASPGQEEDEDLTLIAPDQQTINLTHTLYECIVLALPARRVHSTGQCDPAVQAVLDRMQETNDQVGPTDARWAALEALKSKPKQNRA